MVVIDRRTLKKEIFRHFIGEYIKSFMQHLSDASCWTFRWQPKSFQLFVSDLWDGLESCIWCNST